MTTEPEAAPESPAEPTPLSFTISADHERECVVLTFSTPVAVVELNALATRQLVEGVMRAGQRLAQLTAPRVVVPDARQYVRKATGGTLTLNGVRPNGGKS